MPLDNELKPEEIIDIIGEASKFKECDLVISGGEPFCRSDVLQILKAASQYFSERATVITNGTLIDDEKARYIADLNIKVQE